MPTTRPETTRLDSLNVLLDPTGKMLLEEAYKGVLSNVQQGAISVLLKNNDLSGDPYAGTVEAKRFANATSQAYGTARSTFTGNAVKGKTVTIPIDINKEFIEEVEQKDISLLGVDGLISRRSANHTQRLIAELDTAFFACAKAEGTQFTPTTATDIQDIIEECFVAFETMKTNYIDGIDRTTLSVVMNPQTYSIMRNYLDTVYNTNVDTTSKEFFTYHGVRVYSSVRLPSDVKFIVMVDGSIAQPVRSNKYKAERIPMSEAFAIEMFFWYGVKAVTPETIMYYTGA